MHSGSRIRLYSTKSFKSLGTLDYHNDAAYAVAFAHPHSVSMTEDASNRQDDENTDDENDENDDDGWEAEDSKRREQWLVSAGKEGRVAFWELSTFEK